MCSFEVVFFCTTKFAIKYCMILAIFHVNYSWRYKLLFINSFCSSVFSFASSSTQNTPQGSSNSCLKDSWGISNSAFSIMQKLLPKAPSSTSDRMDRRSPVNVTAPVAAMAENGDDTSRSKCVAVIKTSQRHKQGCLKAKKDGRCSTYTPVMRQQPDVDSHEMP